MIFYLSDFLLQKYPLITEPLFRNSPKNIFRYFKKCRVQEEKYGVTKKCQGAEETVLYQT